MPLKIPNSLFKIHDDSQGFFSHQALSIAASNSARQTAGFLVGLMECYRCGAQIVAPLDQSGALFFLRGGGGDWSE